MFLTYLKRMAPYIFVAILFIIFDRLLKNLAINNFFLKPHNLAGDWLTLNFTKNYHIAFSLPLNSIVAEALIILIIIGLLYYFVLLLYKNLFFKARNLLFIILAALDNLFDRLRYGFVIDYLDLKYFTVFNLADMMIVGGAVILIWQIFNKKTAVH